MGHLVSIRIRTVNGVRVALCAARSVAKPGDVYLDDADHHALMSKFTEDLQFEGLVDASVNVDNQEIREAEESNNVNRTWWDSVYAPVEIV